MDALNKINVIVPVLMALAQLLGGYLNQNFDFRANFYAIAICVFICLTLYIVFLKETLKPVLRVKFNLNQTAGNFIKVIKNFQFLQLTIVVILVFARFLCFLSTTAILFVTQFNVSKSDYPYYQCIQLVAYLGASLCCTKLIGKFGILFIKKIGLYSIIIGGCALFLVTLISVPDSK